MYDFWMLNLVVHKVTTRLYKAKLPGVCDDDDDDDGKRRSYMTYWGVSRLIRKSIFILVSHRVSQSFFLHFSVSEMIQVLDGELG
jgi:hypothetical protein